jgi:hypothetical protein
MLNLNTITLRAFTDIMELDFGFVGSDNYMGVAYFWAYEYRHYLRDTTNAKRKKVHDRFLKENLELSGVSDRHYQIIKSITKLN